MLQVIYTKKHSKRLQLLTFGPVMEQPTLLSQRPLFSGEHVMLTGILTDTQQVKLTYGDVLDKKGKPAQIPPGLLVWRTSDALIASILPISESPISSLVVAGNPGICEVWPQIGILAGEHVQIQVMAGIPTVLGSPAFGTIEEQP